MLGYVSLGVKFALRRRRVAIFTILSIAISVSLLLSSFAMGSSLQKNAGAYIRSTNSPVDITVASTKWDAPIDTGLMNAISQDSNVVNIIPRIEETAQVQNGSEWLHLLLVGLDPDEEQHIGGFSVTAGSFDLSESFCFLSDTAMQLTNLSIGDHIELHTSAGIHFFEIAGYGFILDKGVLGPAVIIHISNAWDIFEVRYPDNSSNKLLVEVDDVFGIPATENRLRFICGADFIISNQKTYSLWTASIFLSQVNSILGILVIAAFFIAALRVLSSYFLIFTERRFETGIMLAYGASRFQVLTVLIAEISIVGVTGAIVGVFMSLLTGNILSTLAGSIMTIVSPINAVVLFEPSFAISPYLLVVSCVYGLLMTVIAGLIPAIFATRQPVVESLKHVYSGVAGPVTITNKTSKMIWLSLLTLGLTLSVLASAQLVSDLFSLNLIRSDLLRVLFVPSFLLLIGGFSVYLAKPSSLVNVIQKYTKPVIGKLFSASLKRRSLGALLIFNMFVSVSVIFILSSNVSYTLLSSWENTIGWQSSSANVIVYLDETTGLEDIELIHSQQNISEISEMSNTYQFLKHQDIIETGLIFGIEPKTFQNLVAIGIQESFNLSAGLTVLDVTNSCIISDFAAQELDLHIGGVLEVADRVNLTVVAICESSVPVFLFTIIEPLFLFVNTETWLSIMAEPFVASGVLLNSQDPSSTVSSLSEISGVYPILISTVVYDYSTSLDSLSVTINLTLGLLLLTVIISAILSGWSAATARRREIGMLRAQGMESEEIAKILSLENAVPMLSGLITGLVVGFIANLSLAHIVRRFSGGYFSFLDYQSVFLVIMIFLISLLTSYLASFRATKAPIADLLSNRQKTS
jgi:ABC-type lipoprotein release transport system permease subunit